MCATCEKLLSDPKFLMGQTDLKKFIGVVEAFLPILLDAQRRIIRTGVASDVTISPVTIGAVLGWLYYASIFNAIEDKDITEEEFTKFDTLLRADTKEGVIKSIEEKKIPLGKMEVLTFDELPDDIKELVRRTIGDGATKH